MGEPEGEFSGKRTLLTLASVVDAIIAKWSLGNDDATYSQIGQNLKEGLTHCSQLPEDQQGLFKHAMESKSLDELTVDEGTATKLINSFSPSTQMVSCKKEKTSMIPALQWFTDVFAKRFGFLDWQVWSGYLISQFRYAGALYDQDGVWAVDPRAIDGVFADIEKMNGFGLTIPPEYLNVASATDGVVAIVEPQEVGPEPSGGTMKDLVIIDTIRRKYPGETADGIMERLRGDPRVVVEDQDLSLPKDAAVEFISGYKPLPKQPVRQRNPALREAFNDEFIEQAFAFIDHPRRYTSTIRDLYEQLGGLHGESAQGTTYVNPGVTRSVVAHLVTHAKTMGITINYQPNLRDYPDPQELAAQAGGVAGVPADLAASLRATEASGPPIPGKAPGKASAKAAPGPGDPGYDPDKTKTPVAKGGSVPAVQPEAAPLAELVEEAEGLAGGVTTPGPGDPGYVEKPITAADVAAQAGGPGYDQKTGGVEVGGPAVPPLETTVSREVADRPTTVMRQPGTALKPGDPGYVEKAAALKPGDEGYGGTDKAAADKAAGLPTDDKAAAVAKTVGGDAAVQTGPPIPKAAPAQEAAPAASDLGGLKPQQYAVQALKAAGIRKMKERSGFYAHLKTNGQAITDNTTAGQIDVMITTYLQQKAK
jgi:hypothetical protein